MARTRFAILLVLCAAHSYFVESFGYFELEIHKIDQRNGTENVDFTELILRKSNRTRKLNGPVHFRKPFGNNMKVMIYGYKKRGGQYQKIPFKIGPIDFCDFLNEDKYFIPEMTQFSNLTVPTPCPFPAQTILTSNYYPNFEKLPSVIIPSGDYMGELLYIEDGNILVTVHGYGSIHNF